MTNLAAIKLIQNISTSLAIDGLTTPPPLEQAAVAYLMKKISLGALISKASSYEKPASMLFLRALELLSVPPPSSFNTDTLLFVHSKLCSDCYGKCGALRKVNLDQNNGSHTDYKYLKGSLKNVLARLQTAKGSPEIGKADFTAHLAHYMQELNILSPFQEFNGFTRRTFFALFANSRGFDLNFSLSNKKEFAQAETLAFAADNPQLLFACLVKCVSYIGEENLGTTKTIDSIVRLTTRKPIKRTVRKPEPKKAERVKRQKTAEQKPTLQIASRKVISNEQAPQDITQSLTQNNEQFSQCNEVAASAAQTDCPDPDVSLQLKTIQEKLAVLSEELANVLNRINNK